VPKSPLYPEPPWRDRHWGVALSEEWSATLGAPPRWPFEDPFVVVKALEPPQIEAADYDSMRRRAAAT
jgi:hypothetical protein